MEVALFFSLGLIGKAYFMLNYLINSLCPIRLLPALFIFCYSILKEVTFKESYLICQQRLICSECTLNS